MRRGSVGWWHVAISLQIAVYYAAVIAWAVRYTLFSFYEAWGDDPGVPFNDLLLAGEPGAGATVVAGVLVPLALVRLAVLRRDL